MHHVHFCTENQIHWFTGGFKPEIAWFPEEDSAELSPGPAVQKCLWDQFIGKTVIFPIDFFGLGTIALA